MAKDRYDIIGQPNAAGLASKVNSLQSSFLAQFPEPPSRSPSSKSAKDPVHTGKSGKGGKLLRYERGGIAAWKKIESKLRAIQEDLASLAMRTSYVRAEKAPAAVASVKRKGKGKR